MRSTNDVFPLTIVNDDGTLYEPPILPEYEALKKKYPQCKGGFDYRCMYCNKCLLGDYFVPTDEDKPILKAQRLAIDTYILEHNPSIRELIKEK